MAHIRYAGPEAVLDALVDRYPILAPQKEDIRALYELIRQSFASGGKLLVCGNGGSAADALHIVGELMKSFTLPRPIDAEAARLLSERFGQEGERLVASLEGALPAVALVENAALSTALQNDVSGGVSFAQQVYGLGRPGMCCCVSPPPATPQTPWRRPWLRTRAACAWRCSPAARAESCVPCAT